jgi:hypothetical protein
MIIVYKILVFNNLTASAIASLASGSSAALILSGRLA